MKKAIIIFMIFSTALLMAYNDPKLVGIYVRDTGGIIVPEENLTFDVYVDGRPGEVLHVDSPGCGYKELSTMGLCYINLAAFTTAWSSGDILIWEVYNNAESMGTVNQTVDTANGASQYDTDYWGGAFLPVTLSSFTAVYQNGLPVLQWVTISEINNAGWNVYRSGSKDMSESMQINPELISGAGTTTETRTYEFTDEMETEAGKIYYYQLENVEITGETEQYGPISIMIPDDEGGDNPEVPVVYGLLDNYPNPFNPDTKICFVPESEGNVSLNIINIKGQKVKSIYSGYIDSEEIGLKHSFIWNGTNETGIIVSSGIYFYQYISPEKIQTKKMLLIK